MCGFSIGDYVRMRRLSLAGEELSKGNAGIIDVALKYGYDTPESFSRAFTRFHGVSPSEAKRGGKVRIFTPLSVKLILTGGLKMTGIRGIRALQCRTRKNNLSFKSAEHVFYHKTPNNRPIALLFTQLEEKLPHHETVSYFAYRSHSCPNLSSFPPRPK